MPLSLVFQLMLISLLSERQDLWVEGVAEEVEVELMLWFPLVLDHYMAHHLSRFPVKLTFVGSFEVA